MTHQDFDQLKNKFFFIRLNEKESLELVLHAVRPYPVKDLENRPNEKIPFSLDFHSPGESRYLNQGTYTLRNEEMGEVILFLNPRGVGENGMIYEVVVN